MEIVEVSNKLYFSKISIKEHDYFQTTFYKVLGNIFQGLFY